MARDAAPHPENSDPRRGPHREERIRDLIPPYRVDLPINEVVHDMNQCAPRQRLALTNRQHIEHRGAARSLDSAQTRSYTAAADTSSEFD